jgi:hypothetical protein
VKFLIDKVAKDLLAKMQAYPDYIAGQLFTPLTRYASAGCAFAIDNGSFSRFDGRGFARMIQREEPNRDKCLFVTVPDVVGNARRTMEIWQRRHKFVQHWPMALVAQDGIEDMDIPWDDMKAIFIGGRDPWKDSQASLDIVKTAKIFGIHVHVGRVNTERRFRLFHDAGADTCDGSGVARYDHMLEAIAAGMEANPDPTLFDCEEAA